MTFLIAIFSLLIALTSASLGHIGFYGYHGPPAPLSSDGRVIETPEVAHARAAHLAAYAAALSATDARADPATDDPKAEDDVSMTPTTSQEENKIYTGPLAPLGEDGHVIDTPEVARAKAEHLAAHADAVKKIPTIVWEDDADANHLLLVPSHVAYTIRHKQSLYRGPSAPLAPDGRVMDTQEVAEAKAAHLRAYAHTATLAEQQINDNCHC